MITITLQQIKDNRPCKDGWKTVLKANGGKNADMNKSFPISSILGSNDLDDTLWTLRCLPDHNKLFREFACWCALLNIELIKPYCSYDDYDLIVKYLTTQNEGIRDKAESAAKSTARSAALSAVESAIATKLREVLDTEMCK